MGSAPVILTADVFEFAWIVAPPELEQLLSDFEARAGARHPAECHDESSRPSKGVFIQSRWWKLFEAVRRHGEAAELGQHSLDQSHGIHALGRLLVWHRPPAKPGRERPGLTAL